MLARISKAVQASHSFRITYGLRKQAKKQARQTVNKATAPAPTQLQPESWAQKKSINMAYFIFPALTTLTGTAVFAPFPFNNVFFYGLAATDILCSLFVLSFFRYPSNKFISIPLGGSLLASTLLVPTLSSYSVLTQVIQVAVLVWENDKNLQENAQLSLQQEQLLKQRIFYKLSSLFLIMMVLLGKLYYQHQAAKMEKKLTAIDEKNLQLNSTPK